MTARYVKFFILFLVSLIIGLTVPDSFAQSEQGGSARKKPRETTLSFEDELIEGANQKPELFYLFQKKKFNYKRLIKLRENFLPEMRKTSEEIQRSRSQ